MTRQEFLDKLSAKLDKLPAEERENALDYYNEIFMDAGEENEEKTAEEIGSIDDIARQIYTENGIDPDGKPKFMMEDFVDRNESTGGAVEGTMPYVSPFQATPNQNSGVGLLIFILLFPIWFPILAVVFALSFTLMITLLALEFSFCVCGVAGVVSGIVYLFRIPPVGLTYFGGGLFLLGLFGLTVKAAFKGIRWSVVSVFTGMINACRRLVIGGAA